VSTVRLLSARRDRSQNLIGTVRKRTETFRDAWLSHVRRESPEGVQEAVAGLGAEGLDVVDGEPAG
jgi:hypothetical protein